MFLIKCHKSFMNKETWKTWSNLSLLKIYFSIVCLYSLITDYCLSHGASLCLDGFEQKLSTIKSKMFSSRRVLYPVLTSSIRFHSKDIVHFEIEYDLRSPVKTHTGKIHVSRIMISCKYIRVNKLRV